MKRTQVVKNFKRVVSSLDGSASPEFPSMASNFRISGGKLAFRYGVAEVVASPVTVGQTFKCHALGFVQNTSGTAEFLSVENRNGTIRPYTISKTTLARTQIGTDTVADTPWVISSYADNAYFINPGGTATVYRHVINDNASFTALENVAYSAPPSPNLTITQGDPVSISTWASTDTISYVNSNAYIPGMITPTFNADGSILLNGPSTDSGGAAGGYLEITQVFAASKDLSGADYFYVNLVGKAYLNYFTAQTTLPQFRIGGVWTNVTDAKWFFDSATKEATWVIYARGLTLTAVEGIRFRMSCKPGRAASLGSDQDIATITPLYQGGYFLESTAGTDRIWGSSAPGDNITYGVRFTDGGGTVSSIESESLSAAGAKGDFASLFSCRTGGRIILSCNAPSSPYDRVQFLRLDELVDPPDWKLLNTDTTEPFLFQDTTLESAVSALTTITTGTSPDPVPVFRTDGIVGMFPFKQFAIWMINAGTANIQMSRVGDAEELYSDEATYDADDLTQPAQRTLADNADDIPVWGTQAGDVAFIVGSKAAYVLTGNFPVDMSPSRQIAGSRGIVGRYAGARFRPKNGQYAAAYCDPDFNIWVIASAPQFEGDGRVSPVELSLPVRGKIRDYLYTQQRYEYPSLDSAKTQLEFDEQTSSLWVILGNRAAIFRQDMNGEGWEFHEYSLRTPDGETTLSACTPFFGNGAVASSVAPGDSAWSDVGYPFDSDDAYCYSASLGFGTSKTTETLRLEGYTPTSLIPASATIDSVAVKLERKKTGDLAVTETTVQPRKAGVNLGSNLSTSVALTTSDVETEFALASLPTVAEINAGDLDLDLKYTQETWLSAWNDPANWTIVITPTSPDVYPYASASSASHTTAYSVTYTWIGGGTAPTQVWATYTGSTSLSCVSPANGTGSTNNGLGDTASGDIYNNVGIPPDPGSSASLATSGTDTERLTLTAGVATKTITMVSTATVPAAKMRATHTLTAGIYTPTASAVQVDAARYEVCYTVTTSASAPSWIGWDQTCFTYDGRFVGIRSVGNTDLIEWDFRANAYIAGDNRDAGYAPPVAEYVTQDFSFEGVTARFSGVQVHTSEVADTPSVYSKITGGSFVAGFGTGYSTSRWWRFPIGQRGINHVFKLTIPETDGGVEGLAFEFEPTSKSKVR